MLTKREVVGVDGLLSDKLFHGVNEDREFGGFGFRGRSKGQSERKRTIARRRGSCGAMKDKACGVVDLF